jgi:hypothetical protein
MKIKYDELKRQCSALKENLNATAEQRYSPQRDRHDLVDPEGSVIMMLEEPSCIQEALLIIMEERDTLISEHERLKMIYDELKRQCSALKKCKCHFRKALWHTE